MKNPRVLIPVLILAVLGLGFGGYSYYWFHFAQKLRQSVLDETAQGRGQGYDPAWESYEIAGYPLAFRIGFTGASLAHNGGDGKWTVRAEHLTAEARPWSPLKWQAMAGKIVLSAGAGTNIGLTQIDEATATLSFAATPPANHKDEALSAEALLSRVTLPAGLPSLGPGIETVSLSLSVKGALAGKGALKQNLAAWRDDGGTVEVQSAEIDWGPLSAKAAGTLALDGQMQPVGALTATIKGYGAAVDALVAGNAMRPGDATLAKFAMSALAKPGADGKPRLEAPLTLQNGYLFLGPAKIARLPEVGLK